MVGSVLEPGCWDVARSCRAGERVLARRQFLSSPGTPTQLTRSLCCRRPQGLQSPPPSPCTFP